MRRSLPMVIAALLLLSGCAAPAPAEPHQAAPSEPRATGEAVELINLWRVTEAAGSGPDAFLRLDGTGLMAWTDCGIATGSWRASGTAFIADINGALGGGICVGSPATGAISETLDWLLAASAFRIFDGRAELLDPDGDVVAVLTVDGAPPARPDHSNDFLLAPQVTPEDEARFAPPVSLPAGATPAGSDDLVGRWEPSGLFAAERPYVDFDAAGTWAGSDGCNGGAGRWALGDDGIFLATSGASTLMACDGVGVPHWVGGASRAAIVASRLVLFDAAGAELGSLVRA